MSYLKRTEGILRRQPRALDQPSAPPASRLPGRVSILRRRTGIRGIRAVAATVGMAALLAGCASAAGNSASSSTGSKGGIVTFAELPNTPPNYIFPLTGPAYFDVANVPNFTDIMYRPLYWFGTSGEPTLNQQLSLAQPPVFSDGNQVVTINLKHWRWSDGTPITARDVVFWMNLLEASISPAAASVGSSSAPGPGWGAYVPGSTNFPGNVTSYRATGTYQVVFHLNGGYNPTWYTYNELSQISPLPQQAWDKTSSSSPDGNYDATVPGTATTGALGVAAYLNQQSQNLSTYATNPLWQVVDGPFRLSEFTTSGFVKMVPNKEYSGSPKPSISAFEEEPFTSDAAEFDQLRSGAITIGYLPSQYLSQKASLTSHGYTYAPWYIFGFYGYPYNFSNPTMGPVFRQLYFPQAFQSLIDQREWISAFQDGVGTVDNGPVPTYPAHNPDESPLEANGTKDGMVYPYSPSRAVSLLKAHGWKVVPGGTTTCARAGTAADDCGPGIPAGLALNVQVLYASGITSIANEMQALQSTMRSQAGIDVQLTTGTYSDIIGTVFAGCTLTAPCSNWEIANWGTGFSYDPNVLPTGGEYFGSGAPTTAGLLPGSKANALIQAEHTAPTRAAEFADLFKMQDYIAQQLPMVFMPNGPYQLTLYKSDLQGVVPQGILNELNPESYRY